MTHVCNMNTTFKSTLPAKLWGAVQGHVARLPTWVCFKIYVDVGGDPIWRTIAYRFWQRNHNKPRELGFFSSVFVLGDMPDTQINV